MTAQFRTGDRVRITFEGKVASTTRSAVYVTPDPDSQQSSRWVNRSAPSMERIGSPIPEAVGTVFKNLVGGDLYVLTASGVEDVQASKPSTHRPSLSVLAGGWNKGTIIVVFDPTKG